VQARPQYSRLPLFGLLIGVWAILPPYISTFGKLNVQSRVEIADHVVPGLVVLAVSVVGYLVLRSPDPSMPSLFGGGAVITLAGFWMVVTHVPLISQSRNHIVPAGAVAWHGLPGLAVMLLGILWVRSFWDWEEESDGAS